MGGSLLEIMKNLEKPKVFLGLGVGHGAEVTKTLCFPKVLKARLQKPVVFVCFESDPGRTGSGLTPAVLYQIRQNPYSESTVWGKRERSGVSLVQSERNSGLRIPQMKQLWAQDSAPERGPPESWGAFATQTPCHSNPRPLEFGEESPPRPSEFLLD